MRTAPLTIAFAAIVCALSTAPARAADTSGYTSEAGCLRAGEPAEVCARFREPMTRCLPYINEATASLRAMTTTRDPQLLDLRSDRATRDGDKAMECIKTSRPPEGATKATMDRAVADMQAAARAAERHYNLVIYGR